MAKKTPHGICIAIGNQKGGVGKTTNTVHLAAALGERGHKVLVIDLDPSAGATHHLGVNPVQYAGTFELFTREDPDPQKLAVRTKDMPKNVELIPSRQEVREIPKYLSKYIDEKMMLKRGLEKARDIWDMILLDTAPSTDFITTVNAYSLSEWFLLSAFPHALSLHGINEALEDIADVRAQRNPALEVLGVIVGSVDGRTKAWREIDEAMRELFPGRHFSTVVSQAEAIRKASEKGRTVINYPKYSTEKVAEQYRILAEEIERRVLNRELFISGGQMRLDEPQKQLPAPETSAMAGNE